jgi:hypothetical protein
MPPIVVMTRGRLNVAPPLSEVAWKKTPLLSCWSNPDHTTYTRPPLSVRMAQPCRPPVWALLVAAEIWLVRHVSPASLERWNITGSGAPARPLLRKLTLHT